MMQVSTDSQIDKCKCQLILTGPWLPNVASEKLNHAGQQARGCDSFIESNQTFYTLSETEDTGDFRDQYGSSCQDTMMCASYTGCTRLMSKTSYPVKLPGLHDF